MTLQERIVINQKKHAKFQKYERMLHRIRLRVFDYEDAGKLDKAHRVMALIKKILQPYWEARQHAAMEPRLRNYMM